MTADQYDIPHFLTEYFILLTEEELSTLVKAKNRDDYQPEFKRFLYTTKRLKELRQLAFPSGANLWTPPQLTLEEDGTVIDMASQRPRGRIDAHPLPARPG